MKKQSLVLLLVFVLLLAGTASVGTAQDEHNLSILQSVDGSGVIGVVDLSPRDDGTRINVVAFGLESGVDYVSLYYDNHTCELEPYSEEDVIGGPYQAFQESIGFTAGTADDAIDEINSVSVRRASDFALLACADTHPGS